MSDNPNYFANQNLEVTFSIARGSELRRDLKLFVLDDDGSLLGELHPESSIKVQLNKSKPIFKFGTAFNTPKFQFDISKDTAEMHWSGRHWTCSNAIQIEGPSNGMRGHNSSNAANTTATQNEESSPFVMIGIAGMIAGVAWLVFAFKMNVFVCGGFWSGTELCSDSERVVNLNLTQTRNLHFGGAALLTLCSLLTLFFGLSRKKNS